MGRFDAERDWWRRYIGGLSARPDVRAAITGAIARTHERYDTAIYENRFVVGGIVEHIIGASSRAVGVPIDQSAKWKTGVDLALPDRLGGLSVKGTFAPRTKTVRLINTMGRSETERSWEHATVFVNCDHGLGYADPEYLAKATAFSGDAIEIEVALLDVLWKAEEGLLYTAVEVPAKPRKRSNPRAASDYLSHDILSGFPELRDHWRPEVE